jgi:uncharacterized repeat protein (TIGR03843 family)
MRPERPDAMTLLRRGDVVVKGRMPWSSNGTFLAELCLDGHDALAVYKPVRGERGLWDFPPGLHVRETAAYALSEALGWRLVPETVIREGPLGVGSMQRFVPADFEQHYFTLHETGAHKHALQAICAFDLLANNADRKSGHCLLDEDGHIWGIDHGLCFHEEPKLRTVIWDFGGEPVPDDLLAAVARFAVAPPVAPFAGLLDDDELEALIARAGALVRRPVFPQNRSGYAYPWPVV